MKKITYDGPRDMVRVRVNTTTVEHHKGKIEEYPDEVASELLAEKKNKFREAGKKQSGE
jgi:hypothetical protein